MIYLDQPNSGGPAQEKAMIQVKTTPAAAWVPVNLKLPMGLQTTMYLSTARTTSDQRATSPTEKKVKVIVIKVIKSNCAMCSSKPTEERTWYFVFLTSKCGHESLNSAGSGSKNEVAIKSRCDGDGESEGAHDQSSHSQVDQDVVERLPELLVLSRYQQCQTVDGSSSADQEEHVES